VVLSGDFRTAKRKVDVHSSLRNRASVTLNASEHNVLVCTSCACRKSIQRLYRKRYTGSLKLEVRLFIETIVVVRHLDHLKQREIAVVYFVETGCTVTHNASCR
jgi:hypothetical protein